MARRKEPIYHPAANPHVADQSGTVERLLASYGVPPPTTGNRVELVTSGVDAYQRVMRLIEQRTFDAFTSRRTSWARTTAARRWSIA